MVDEGGGRGVKIRKNRLTSIVNGSFPYLANWYTDILWLSIVQMGTKEGTKLPSVQMQGILPIFGPFGRGRPENYEKSPKSKENRKKSQNIARKRMQKVPKSPPTLRAIRDGWNVLWITNANNADPQLSYVILMKKY